MQIASVRIQNYRSIRDEEFAFGELTTLVGPNGCGKSAALRAIKTFYETSQSLTVDDYYNRDDGAPVKIAVAFSDLSDEERALYAPYIHEGAMTVTKVITPGSERYHGTRKGHPEFRGVRDSQSKTDVRAAYNELRGTAQYADLPTVRNADQAEQELTAWESAHPDQCELMEDSGQFFGFRNVGQSRLERFTRFVFVPAVREAEDDANDSRGSAVYELMEMVVRSAIAQNKEFNDFKANVQERYTELIGPERLTQLGSLSERLTRGLRTYVPAASVILDWQSIAQLDVPLPRAFVRLEEDGFQAPVDRVGHGLQRAFVLSLLQDLVGAQVEKEKTPEEESGGTSDQDDVQPALPSLILGIEEPELYQHPSRQRSLAKTFQRLSQGGIAGVALKTQVMYCTHSPLFVDIERFECIRRLSKTHGGDGLPKVTRATRCTLQEVAEALARAQDDPDSARFTADSLRWRMHALMTPWMNEGFFADVVVLVEGETDRAAILGAAAVRDVDLESQGVAVIPCGGKASIDRPLLVFRGLNIPTYVVFDADVRCASGDLERTARSNRALQRLLGIGEPKGFPDTSINSGHAVFDSDLNTIIHDAVGDDIYVQTVWREFKEDRGYSRIQDAEKSPAFMERVLQEARTHDIEVPVLSEIVEKVGELVQRT